MKMSRLGTTMAAAVIASLPLAASAESIRLTLATMPVPGETVPRAGELFAEKMKERAGEDFEIVYNDSLITGPELAPSVRDGRVEMSVTTYPYLSSAEPRFGLANLPGIASTPEEYRALAEGFAGEEWAKLWEEEWNGIPLVEGVWTPVTLYTTVPIRTVEDFEGKRLRVSNVETGGFITELGATSVPLPAGEIMTGLERGVIDGFFTAVCWVEANGFFEDTIEYINNWGIAPQAGWTIVINKDVWNGLDSETQALMREVGQEVEDEMWELFYSMNQDCFTRAAANGVEIIDVADEEKQKAFDQAGPVFDDWYERAAEKGFDGQEFVTRARESLN